MTNITELAHAFCAAAAAEDRHPATTFGIDNVERWLATAIAQQPASDGGFTAADMMDARQEGRKEAQQAAADPKLVFGLGEAKALVEFFGGSNTAVAVQRLYARQRMSRPGGLYAWCDECPEEGSVYLGPVDTETEEHDDAPQQPAAPSAPAEQSSEWVPVRRSDLLEWAKDWQVDHGEGDGDIVTPFDGYLLCTLKDKPPAETQGGVEVAYFRKEMIARCREYAAGMVDIGADPHDLEAALAPLLGTVPPSAPVRVVGFDEWFDEYTKNNYTDEMLALAAWEQALAQQPAADPLVEWGNRPLNFTATVGTFNDGVQPAAVGVGGPKAYCRECNAAGMSNCANFDECGGARCITCHQQLNQPAQQPAAVDEEMVERFIAATNKSGRQLPNAAYDMVRRGLTAALAAQQGGAS